MMNQQILWDEYSTLPPQAQERVLEFLELMKKSYHQMPLAISESRAKESITNHPFVGLWQDREEMQDSTEWVRNQRANNWGHNR